MTLPSIRGNMLDNQIQRYRIFSHFSICKDPRKCRIEHDLLDIIVIVVLATLCGEEGWDDFHFTQKIQIRIISLIRPFQV